jgi:hypothetical protein
MSLRTGVVQAPWTTVLRVLGVPVASEALPSTAECPVCGGPRLRTYEDSTTGGVWHHCFDCRAAGDSVELAGLAWKLPPAAALLRLEREGVPLGERPLTAEDVEAYVATELHYRARAAALWQGCREYLSRAGSRELAALRTRFRLQTGLSPERWDAGPANLVGGIPHREVDKVFFPDSLKPSGENQSGGRTFKGGGWGDVLVVPFHAAPGRISGFYCVGRRGGAKDRVFRPAAGRDGVVAREAGLAGLWTVENPTPSFRHHVFAVDDPMLACRLQVRHFGTDSRPLPLVAFYQDRTRRTDLAWAALGRRQPVFWCWQLTAKVVHQAITAGGMISVVPVEDTSRHTIDHYIRHDPPVDLLHRALKRARHWKDALRHWTRRVPVPDVQALLLELEPYGHEAGEFAFLGEAVMAALVTPERVRQVRLGRTVVRESDGCWRIREHRGGAWALLADCILRVDQVVPGETGIVYRGRVERSGREAAFEHRRGQGRGSLATTITAALGVPVQLDYGWGERLLDVALAFRPIETSPAVS